jgi:hypothetical protein
MTTGVSQKGTRQEPEQRDQIAYLTFDGVYMNSDIWINGKCLAIVRPTSAAIDDVTYKNAI